MSMKSKPVCSCGAPILGVPHKHLTWRSNDEFAGIYFQCDICKSTLFIPEPKPQLQEEAA
jgi:hypothetical protein